MKEHAESVLTPREQQLAERGRQYEQPGQQQANPLAECKALIEAQREEIERLKDTLAILKGQKGRPKIKPSGLETAKPGSAQAGGSTGSAQKRAGSAKRAKTAHLTIDQTEILRPEQVPGGSVFKGYQDYVGQELEIQGQTTRYRCERWQTPDGGEVSGRLPEALRGSHLGPRLRSYSLSQSYQQPVTQPLIVEGLGELGIEISGGQVNRILTEGKEAFHTEKEALLRTGLAVARYVGVEDTAARHRGQKGYCPYMGTECFTGVASTESKSRRNVLDLLRAGPTDSVLNEAAREYRVRQQLPKAQRQLCADKQTVAEPAQGEAYLQRLGIPSARPSPSATDGALLGRALSPELPPALVILRAEAGQFNLLRHALGWGQAERTLHKLRPISEAQREAVETGRGQIWDCYPALKASQRAPCPQQQGRLEAGFEDLFTAKTCLQSLN